MMKSKCMLVAMLLIGSAFLGVANLGTRSGASYFFWDPFEAGGPLPGWTDTGASSLWHYVNENTDPCIGVGSNPTESHSYNGMYGYHDDVPCTYSTGAQTTGQLVSPWIDLSGTPLAWLHFTTWFENEGGAIFDTLWVTISPDGSSWNKLLQIEDGTYAMGQWLTIHIDISAYALDPTVQIGFAFDSWDGTNNAWAGWYLDDVLVDDVAPVPTPGLSPPFLDNFDPGPSPGWTWNSLWHPVDSTVDPCMSEGGFNPPAWLGHPKSAFSGNGAMAYHIDPPSPSANDCTYNNGAWNKGWLKSPAIDLVTGPPNAAHLSFWFWFEAEQGFENLSVEISTDDFASDVNFLNNIMTSNYRMAAWNFYSVDISSYLGNTVWIRFIFDTFDDIANDFAGWYVDNFAVDFFPTIHSQYIYTNDMPVIDGVIGSNEWFMQSTLPDGANNWDDLQALDPLNLIQAFMVVENDRDSLYILYDAIGDTTNDIAPTPDGAQVSFDPENDDAVGGGDFDDEWGIDGYYALGGGYHYSNGALADACLAPAACASGFGTSPNDPVNNHRIYEFRIPLSMLGFGTNPNVPWPVTPGYTMGFSGGAGPMGFAGNPAIADRTGGTMDQWPYFIGTPIAQPLFGDLIIGTPMVPANDYPVPEDGPKDPLLFEPVDKLDAMQFEVNGWDHAVVGIRENAATDDYRLAAWSDTRYTGPPLVTSQAPQGQVDFLALGSGTYGSPPNRAVAVSWLSGVVNNDYRMEMENDLDDHSVNDVWTGRMENRIGGAEVLDAYMLSVPSDGSYNLTLTMTMFLDLDFFLLDLSTASEASRSAPPPRAPLASSETDGPGITERLIGVPLLSANSYVLVVTNENGQLGDYTIGETLWVSHTNLAPSAVSQWDVNVEMLNLRLQSTGATNVTGMNITRTGTGTDADVKSVSVYHDVDDNLAFDPGVDELLGRSYFVGGVATFNFPTPFPMLVGTIENLTVIYSIHPLANVGNTVGAAIPLSTDIVLDDFDSPVLLMTPLSVTPTIGAGSPPQIQSEWASTAPTSDGTYTAGEHILNDGVNAFNLQNISGNPFPTWLIVENDGTNLYVTFDAVGDTTDDGASDDSSFGLDTDNNNAPTDGADDQFDSVPSHYEYDALAMNWVWIDLCTAPGLYCTKGFGTSPNSGTNHVIYEYQVPLAEIGASPIPSTPIGFLGGRDSQPMVWDASNLFDYVSWPQVLWSVTPLTEYGDLLLAPYPDLDVSGTPVASGVVLPTQNDVVVEQLTLTASTDTIDVTGIRVDQTGTAGDTDTGEISLYDDVNDNGALNPGTDVLLDTKTFSSKTLTFAGAPLITVSPGTPERVLIVFNISAVATVGAILKATIMDSTYVTVAAPAVVNAFAQIDSNLLTISLTGGNNVSVVGVPKTSGSVFAGSSYVPMLQLNLTVDADDTTVTAVKVDQVGTCADADISEAQLFFDFNGNGILEPGTDLIKDVKAFTGGTLTFSSLSLFFTSAIVERLFVAVNVSSSATVGCTIELNLGSSSYITLVMPDQVNSTTFPISSNAVTVVPPVLTVSGSPVASGTVNTGDTYVVFEALTLSSNFGTITLTSLQVDQTGIAVGGDTSSIRLYHDVNDNGSLDLGTDVLLDTQVFSFSTLTFGPLTFDVVEGTPEHLLVVFDISPGATPGHTLEATILTGYAVVSAPAMVSPFAPLVSNELIIIAPGVDVLAVSGTLGASGSVFPGDSNILMERLVLSASSGTVTVTGVTVDRTGTGVDGDTAAITLYDDTNSNGALDPGLDILLSSKTFALGTLTFDSLSFVVSAGTPRQLLIAFNVSGGATAGNSLGATLVDSTYVSVGGSDVVSSMNFPIQSGTITVTSPPGNVLTVAGTPVASGSVNVSQTNVVMERLTLSASAGTITVSDLTIDRMGPDPDIASAKLYHDVNDNGLLDSGTDVLLGTQVFSGGSLTFPGLSFPVVSGTPESLLLVVDISIGATAGDTVSLRLPSSAYLVVGGSDVVSSSNFPIESNIVTIVAPATTGTMTGKVVDQSANPIANATVQLINSTGWVVATTSTNAAGDFAFSPVFGTYTLNATKYGYGYNSSAPAGAISSGSPTYGFGSVVLRQVTTSQPTTGTVEGWVYDSSGSPVQGAKVDLLDDSGDVVASKTTDSGGHFKFDAVAFGTYSLSLSKEGLANLTSDDFTLDGANPEHVSASTMAAPGGGGGGGVTEAVPAWSWLLLVLALVLFVVSLLLLLMGRRKKPEPEMQAGPEGMVQPAVQVGPAIEDSKAPEGPGQEKPREEVRVYGEPRNDVQPPAASAEPEGEATPTGKKGRGSKRKQK